MRCLVVGAAGFIGRSLTKKLIKEDFNIRGLIHNTKPKEPQPNVEYVNGDITNIESIKNAFKNIDVVFHCAALVKDYGPKKNFYGVNLNGTKNLVKCSEEYKIKKFIFLSHINYESNKNLSYYSETKALAEQFLTDKFKNDNFPMVVIRPGNVYGPGATVWVLRILESIKKNRIAVVEEGKGIFLHTYIDNLLDAMIAAMEENKALGEIIDITDGDNTVTYKEYFNLIAKIAGKPPVKKSMSKKTAMMIAKSMVFLNKITGIKPWVTPMAVHVLTNNNKVSIVKARKLLKYEPKIDFNEGMIKVEEWLRQDGYI